MLLSPRGKLSTKNNGTLSNFSFGIAIDLIGNYLKFLDKFLNLYLKLIAVQCAKNYLKNYTTKKKILHESIDLHNKNKIVLLSFSTILSSCHVNRPEFSESENSIVLVWVCSPNSFSFYSQQFSRWILSVAVYRSSFQNAFFISSFVSLSVISLKHFSSYKHTTYCLVPFPHF